MCRTVLVSNAPCKRLVACRAYVVAARVYTKLGSHGDSAAEEEQCVEHVESQRDGSVTHEAVIEGDGYQVEQ